MRSLYADLLDSNNSSSPDSQRWKPTPVNPALQFQPARRPQPASQKPKTKTPKAVPGLSTTDTAESSTKKDPVPAPAAPTTKPSNLAAWAKIDEDEDALYYNFNERSRGGRKKRKKNNSNNNKQPWHNWDDIYDPTRPCSYEEYRQSDERWQEVRDWKDRLYARQKGGSEDVESSDGEGRDAPRNHRFAPPAGLNFAPPPNLNAPPQQPSETQSSPPHVSSTADDHAGEDARPAPERSSQVEPSPAPVPDPELAGSFPKPNPSQHADPESNANQNPSTTTPEPTASTFTFATTISRPPVRYTLPNAPADLPTTEEEIDALIAAERDKASSPSAATEQEQEQEPDPNAPPRSLRPGQPGFAQRLLAKYGWTHGTGLGRERAGIVQPLRVKMAKDKDKNTHGNAPAAKIVGGQKAKGAGGGDDGGRFGALSEVVVMYGMVEGMDVEREIEGEEGGLMQEIGDECASKYGRVERVFIHRQNTSGSAPVFVKFVSQLSALRAVNALEGRTFNGNKISARFYDAEKFADGIYE